MKKSKTLLLTIGLSALLCLSGCSLFNDDDIAVSNKYNPPAYNSSLDPNAVVTQGVVAQDVEGVDNTYCFKSVCYASDDKIANTYKVGGVNHTEYNVNNNEDYYGSKSRNNYDQIGRAHV